MADLVKIFYDIGRAYSDRGVENFNEIDRKKIDKVVVVDLKETKGEEFVSFEINSIKIYDKDAIKDRLYLRVTSPNGGNLYPFFYYDAKKLEASLKKAISNMKKYQDGLDYLDSLLSIDFDRIKRTIAEYELDKKSSIYLAISIEGKMLNELYPNIAQNYAKEACNSSYTTEIQSYFGDIDRVGYDAGLNFCSLNEMTKTLASKTKYRLLSLTKDEACRVKEGFEIIFDTDIFYFYLFGLHYYMLPTIFLEDKRKILDKIKNLDKSSYANLQSSPDIRIRKLLKRLAEDESQNRVLLSFLFAQKSNNAINLHTLIEDISPSKISQAISICDEMRVSTELVKYSQRDSDTLYIRDYIDNALLLAELILGKRSIVNREFVISKIAHKMLYQNSKKNADRKSLSTVIGVESRDSFRLYQRFLDFFIRLNVLDNSFRYYIYREDEMDSYDRFSDLAREKFESVELLQTVPRAREFYTLGALSKLVMDWQYQQKSSESLKNYLDSIGRVSMQNINRVFRKVYEISRKYSMYGEKYDDLISLYTEIKESLTKDDKISLDEANIAFVMGSVDYKHFNQSKKSEEGDK